MPGRRVFLDAGAHLGETLEEVVRPEWAFDRIVCFEPASSCWPSLRERADARVELMPFGLWTRDEQLELHDPGSIGASISAGKARTALVETCQVRDAARWFQDNIAADDVVYLKLNVEGAECDVLDRLMDTDEIRKVTHLLVHFDVLKIPAQEHRAAQTAARLRAAGVDWIEARRIMFGRSHALKTANWLGYTTAGAWGRMWRRHPVRLVFRARQVAYRVRVRMRGR